MISSIAARSIALLLILALSGLALTGCQTGHANANDKPEAVKAAEAEHPIRIAMGEEIELVDYVAPGQITIFDFMSDYCPPCRQIAPYLEKIHAERDDITVIKVDINRPGQRGIDWRSPVARQYGLSSIPAFKVYDAEGALVAEDREAQEMVFNWINEIESGNGEG